MNTSSAAEILQPQDWFFSVPIAYGPGRLTEIGARCVELGVSNPLIVTDKGSRDLPFVAQLQGHLSRSGPASAVICDISPNPRNDEIGAGCHTCRTGKHDAIIAIGGGSAMDGGKAICLTANNAVDIIDFDYLKPVPVLGADQPFPTLITIPTTAGTGAETEATAMEKDIAYPTDTRLHERARVRLVKLAQDLGIDLRQSCARLGPRLAQKVGRYAHARQFKRMRKGLRTLKDYTGRVMRDIERQFDSISDPDQRAQAEVEVALVARLLRQKPRDNGKLYALQEPQVDCISKGKAHKRYEFGCKVSVATTLKEGFVVGMRSLPGNPYDGHTLREALEQVEILTDTRPRRALVDRCPLKGPSGDALHAVLCGAGHNIRLILAHPRALCGAILAAILRTIAAISRPPRATEPQIAIIK